MEHFPWIAAIVVLAAGIVWQRYEHHQQEAAMAKQIKDLQDRLMAKTPEQYFQIRMNEKAMDLEAAEERAEEPVRMGVPMGPSFIE
jgi:hypothetical protein